MDVTKLALEPRAFDEIAVGRFPGLLGIEMQTVERGKVSCRVPVRKELMAPNGFLHAGALVGVADSMCGYGTIVNLPEGAVGFTTIELKCNFLATVREGAFLCEATPVHTGRTTQVWDAVATDEASGRRLALFRCTELVLWPKET
ncbi:MAG TPA: PaaI family thioesterase [Myxococcaceae bacterium]|nr:PaaI family thioesterase [Myxococcaceae bacterium]